MSGYGDTHKEERQEQFRLIGESICTFQFLMSEIKQYLISNYIEELEKKCILKILVSKIIRVINRNIKMHMVFAAEDLAKEKLYRFTEYNIKILNENDGNNIGSYLSLLKKRKVSITTIDLLGHNLKWVLDIRNIIAHSDYFETINGPANTKVNSKTQIYELKPTSFNSFIAETKTLIFYCSNLSVGTSIPEEGLKGIKNRLKNLNDNIERAKLIL